MEPKKRDKAKCQEKIGYVTVEIFASRLKVAPKTVRDWIEKNKVPAEKIGKCYYIDDPTFLKCMAKKQKRRIEKDLMLMGFAKNELWILGINALGPLHQGREIILELLKRGVQIRILLLDPESPEFTTRKADEEYKEKEDGVFYFGNRLINEYNASIAICRDINNTAKGEFNFEVRIHDNKPTEALVIADPSPLDNDQGTCHYNPYPEKKGTRGVEGKHIPITNIKDPENFNKWVARFDDLWSNAKKVDIQPFKVS